jgi:ribosomally synthesized peptide (two-chain TOMM family)
MDLEGKFMATERLQRRRFLKGLGAIAIATAVGEQTVLSNDAPDGSARENTEKEPQVESRKKKDCKDIYAMSPLGHDYHAEILAQSHHWGVVWSRAIAKAWADWSDDPKSFKSRLIKDPITTFCHDLDYPINIELALKVEVDDKAVYSPNLSQPGKDPWDMKKNELKLYLPAPPKNHALHAIALADYTDTGRTYPFTSL